MHQYLKDISDLILIFKPELKNIKTIEFIGSYDLSIHSVEKIKFFIEEIKYIDNKLILDKDKLSKTIPINEIVTFFVNQKFIVSLYENSDLNSDLKVLNIHEITQ